MPVNYRDYRNLVILITDASYLFPNFIVEINPRSLISEHQSGVLIILDSWCDQVCVRWDKVSSQWVPRYIVMFLSTLNPDTAFPHYPRVWDTQIIVSVPPGTCYVIRPRWVWAMHHLSSLIPKHYYPVILWQSLIMTSCCPDNSLDTQTPYEDYYWHSKGVVEKVGMGGN